MEQLQELVAVRRRHLAGHILHQPIESSAMYWVPEDSRRKRGRPKKTWHITFRDNLEEMRVSWSGA